MSTIPTSRNRGRPKGFDDKSAGVLIQSLDRALVVLAAVANGAGMSLTEIATTTDQSPATCYRILTTLRAHRMTEFDDVSQLWYIGLQAFRIGSSFLGRTQLVEQSRPVMQRIMADTGETANLAILDGAEVVFVSQVETHETIRAFFRPGTRGAVHSSGIGKAILAYFPRDRAQNLLPERLETYTDTTIASRAALLVQLAHIQARGWAVDDEERTLGMRCIAAPIFNAYAEPIAGVSLSGPSVRVRPDRDHDFGVMIRRAADDITRATGGSIPAYG